jgi:hypothetical protein
MHRNGPGPCTGALGMLPLSRRPDVPTGQNRPTGTGTFQCLWYVGGTAGEDEAGPNLAAMAPILTVHVLSVCQSGCDPGCRRPTTK